jgi:hypothetical protein
MATFPMKYQDAVQSGKNAKKVQVYPCAPTTDTEEKYKGKDYWQKLDDIKKALELNEQLTQSSSQSASS